MPVHPRPHLRFRVVHVHHAHPLEPHRPVNQPQRLLQPRLRPYVVPGLERMRRIHAHAQVQLRASRHDRGNLLKPPPQRRPHPGRILNQYSQPAELQALDRLPQSLRHRRHRLGQRCPSTRPGVRHQVIRSQRHRPHQLIAKRLDGPHPHHPVRRRQVDQVVVVDRQRPQPQLISPRPEPRRIHLRDSTPAHSRPHPRAGGKDLQRVAPQLRRAFQRRRQVPCNRRMDSNSVAAVRPKWRNWLREGFGAVFVLGVVNQRRALLLFVHLVGQASACPLPWSG